LEKVIERNAIFHQKVKKNEVGPENHIYGLIIEGTTLGVVLNSEQLKNYFIEILDRCTSVIVSRASPSQKAAVVELVRNRKPDKITLAIGDGANDVNMIKRAHIGIGIFGREGF